MPLFTNLFSLATAVLAIRFLLKVVVQKLLIIGRLLSNAFLNPEIANAPFEAGGEGEGGRRRHTYFPYCQFLFFLSAMERVWPSFFSLRPESYNNKGPQI